MRILICSFFAGALAMATPAWAADPSQQNNSNAIWFENWTALTNATLTISAPNGARSEVFAASGTPVFQLPTRDVADGIYRYELSAATKEKAKIINQIDNGRGEAAQDSAAVAFRTSGHFVVSRGVIIQPKEIKEDS
jgi:hypothetical protein